MRPIKTYYVFMIILIVGCVFNDEKNDIKDIVKTYIQETDTEKISHISVREFEYHQLKIYRIMSEIVYSEDKLPSKIVKVNGYYVFSYLKNKPEISYDEIPEEIIQIKESFDREEGTVFFTPDEWVLALCNDSNQYKLIKHTAHKPLNEIQDLNEIECN